MKYFKLHTIISAILLMAITTGCHNGAFGPQPLTLIDNGKSECVIAYDSSKPAEKFAVQELQEIIKGTTGVNLEAVDLTSSQAKAATKRIIVGKNKLTEKLLGQDLLNGLKDQESLVTRRGNDLILTGGDDWGMIYAIYDFVENEAGYRCYAPYTGGERFVKSDKLVYSGKETRQRPAFPGFRHEYTVGAFRSCPENAAKFYFRNRATQLNWEKYGKGLSYANHIGLKEKYTIQIPGHSVFYFVPPHDKRCVWDKSKKLKGEFKNHPEYFTQNKQGKRVDNAQVCFANPDLRKLFTKRVIEAIKAKGPGIYMVGANDHHNGTYCFCPGCIKMQEKYNTCGGPLWDYLIELCNTIKDDYPDVYITSLAYKEAKQTEKAPDNITFPDNFICDAAFLNPTKTLKEIPERTLENGETFNKFDNLKKWGDITQHLSYWYYGGKAPFRIAEKPSKEFKELRDAGVENVGACGLGEMVFGDLMTYIFFQLTQNPDLDTNSIIKEFTDFKYGAAAPMIRKFIEELEQARRDIIKDSRITLACNDTYERMSFIEPEQIVHWQKAFDKMEELVKDKPVHSRNVRIARAAVDCWTIVFMHRIKAEYPKENFDTQKILKRSLKATAEADKAQMVNKQHPIMKRVLNDMSLYANLKDDTLPQELKQFPRETVFRYLPANPERPLKDTAALTEDPEAVAQWTMKERIKKPSKCKKGIKFELYDLSKKEWVKRGLIKKTAIVPNKYKLYKVCTTYLPMKNRFVFANLWGTSLDIQKLGRYFDPSYQQRQFEYWANLKFEGPIFDPQSKLKDNYISCDQVFLVNKGMKKE